MADAPVPPTPTDADVRRLRRLIGDKASDIWEDEELTDTLNRRTYWEAASNALPPGIELVFGYSAGWVAKFDYYAAAADLLEQEAATQRFKFDMQDASGAKMTRSQPFHAMLELAAEYRKQAQPGTVEFGRSDVWGLGQGYFFGGFGGA